LLLASLFFVVFLHHVTKKELFTEAKNTVTLNIV
jgi:hypothetical protein